MVPLDVPVLVLGVGTAVPLDLEVQLYPDTAACTKFSMACTRGLYTAVLKFSARQFTKLPVSRGPLLCGVFVSANGHNFTTLCIRPVLRHPDHGFRSLARYAPILSTRKIYLSAHYAVTTPSHKFVTLLL